MPRQSTRRVLTGVVTFALMLAQFGVANAGALAGGLALGLLGQGSGLQLSVVGDGGHVDVVLCHDERGGPSTTAPPNPLRVGLERHDRDHVLHFVGTELSRDGSRRAAAQLGAPLVVTFAFPTPAVVAAPIPPATFASATVPDLLRTVVLRV